ncbi:hypothetical protein D3869_25640 (plasmid) [Azospirillum brasilense]|uniref:Uncharacterized protein n=1 Tax=Azospirillum brasilense TaxID=192 RepID=A0A4D8RB11_AZOBR|nr:hypothetical protein [Azospirillum brasilense]QCO18604.1 hypothetical protein D3869_25640 [Azospirillum brasilense]
MKPSFSSASAAGCSSMDDPGPALARARALTAGWGAGARALSALPAAVVPAPYRTLLDHDRGMTAVLSERWGEPVGVRVLRQWTEPDGTALWRDIALTIGPDALPVELASIRIALGGFPAAFAEQLREGTEPFGRLLARNGVAFSVEVLGLLTAPADHVWAAEGRVSPGAALYGRIGRLVRADGWTIAETVELLPRA